MNFFRVFLGTDGDVVTESAGKAFETQIENLGKELAEEMGIPTWALVAILIGKEKCLVFYYIVVNRLLSLNDRNCF